MSYEVNSLCRICLRENEDMVHIFYSTSSFINHISIFTQIRICCQVEVLPEDGLPQQICQSCKDRLKIAYDLREMCLSSDSTLRKYLHATDNPHLTEKKGEEVVINESNNMTIDEPSNNEDNASEEIHNKQTKKVKKKKKKATNEDECDKVYTCLECGKTFVYMCLLRHHLVLHTGAKPYLCSACGKSFAHSTTLTNHMKIHCEDKRHKCDICPQSFHRRSHLILHKRTHTGEKPFICPHCGKTFAQATYLKEHTRIHSGEKPFVCETCGRGFARKSCMIMHRRTHTGELPYPCPECNRSFSQRSQRKRHVLKNHKGSVALKENGHLILREHDQLHAVLSTLKTVEHKTNESSRQSSSTQTFEDMTVGAT